MSKIEEAKQILKALGLPPRQQNEISAVTLLALANIGERDAWSDARASRRGIHDILTFASGTLGKHYAENTRESVRRQVIHQFEQAGIVEINPDDPTLATNSPNTHYALTDSVLDSIQAYDGPEWNKSIAEFRVKKKALLDVYARNREKQMVPVRLSSGDKITLSTGRHNELQGAIIEEFAPRFAPRSTLIYLGDTGKKTLILDTELLSKLKIHITQHDKLPDIILYQEKKERVFFVEAVTSHGPVSPKRQYEFDKILQDCGAARIYVSAFPGFGEFKKHLHTIAWETEVWLREMPDHLIHFNGDKFLKD